MSLRVNRRRISVLVAVVVSMSAWARVGGAGHKVPTTPGVVPPNANFRGKTYADWSAAWNKWALEYPLAGHPFTTDPAFDVTARQTGNVWFLAAPFGTFERDVQIPTGTALFFVLLGAEASSLEGPPFHGDTAAEQEDAAVTLVDYAVVDSLFCEIDGVSVKSPAEYRFVSPQYAFTAPSPWINGDVGGAGTSVADGYYVLLNPLSKGQHTLHYGGVFHFGPEVFGEAFDLPLDMTYHITVK